MNAEKYIIYGRVQGVGYRQFVYQNARKLGISGYVRNLADGTVECVASGDPSKLSALFDLLKSGPPHASVKEIHSEAIEVASLNYFEIR